MAFSLFRKKDPVCGMKEVKGNGITEKENWFCSEACQKEYDKKMKPKKSCCCGH